MKPKIRILGSVKKDHLMEMQLHHIMDTRTFLLEYETYSAQYEPSRIGLYSRQGNILITGKDRSIVIIIDKDEDEKEAA